MWKTVIHNVIEKSKEKLPEILGISVTGTGMVVGDIINFVNVFLEMIVKLGYVAVSVFTVLYLIKKAKNIKK